MATTALSAYRAGQRSARGGKTKHRKGSFTLPVAVAAGFAPMGLHLFGAAKVAMSGNLEAAKQMAVICTTGYNTDTNQFYWPAIPMFYGPIVAGMLAHKVANKLGINRAIARAGLPIIRI